MHDYEIYMLLAKATWVVFVFAFGACAGSLTNVLVYRLPRGMGVVTPPSKCPACETQLTWRENIPIFGWLFLRGRCRFCLSPISAEYPLVEAFMGMLLAATFVLFYVVPADALLIDIPIGAIRPEWAAIDAIEGWPRTTWPIFIVFASLLCSLVAMTLVDAKTFTIPLVLPWAATIVAIIFHVGYAAILSANRSVLPSTAPGWIWSLPTPGGNNPTTSMAWWWMGASIAGTLGLGIGLVLIRFGLIRRSFEDYADWEADALKARTPALPSADDAANQAPEEELKPTDPRRAPPRLLGPVTAFLATVALGALVGAWLGPVLNVARWWGLLLGFLAAPAVAGAIHRRVSSETTAQSAPVTTASSTSASGDASPGGPAMWIEYPHARREMLREIAFLAPCLILGILGGLLATRLWTGTVPPLWLPVLSGVLMGYLIAGGIVWTVRIAGSLAFGREAMGLGDVHLMAAVGACVGWIDASVAFPLAAVIGLYWALVGAISRGGLARAMPFGPYLAAASMCVIYGKPVVERGLTAMLGAASDMPVNLP